MLRICRAISIIHVSEVIRSDAKRKLRLEKVGAFLFLYQSQIFIHCELG